MVVYLVLLALKKGLMTHSLTRQIYIGSFTKIAARGAALVATALPVAASAQQLQEYGESLLGQLGTIVSLLIPIVFALILLAFFWGLAKFVFSGAPEGKEDGKNLMLWSVIALFVAASIWGIVNLLQGIFGTTDQNVTVPEVNL
ncbi:MAG: hypothetical protein KatS3mg099_063 [Candidatus Parcubacteria bacterium]|nr:MAG: hypothetical protein KatS3mg099_063 [Candidatus Parcubacteria bacterium]